METKFSYSPDFLQKLKEAFPQATYIQKQAVKGRAVAVEYFLAQNNSEISTDLLEESKKERSLSESVFVHDAIYE